MQSQQSWQRAKSWVRELQRQGNANLVIALAGNKSDCKDMRKVSKEEAEAYAEEQKLAIFLETSAKSGECVNDLFYSIANKLPKQARATPQEGGRGGVVLDANAGQNRQKSQCC
jgi:Ras-related protein Rab-5C